MIHDGLLAVEEALQSAMKQISTEIQNAANDNEYDRIDDLTQVAKRLVSINKEIQEQHVQLNCCPGVPSGNRRKRQFNITITHGALAHSYFVVTPALQSGWMKRNQPITVQLANGEQFTTVPIRNFLRERGRIGAFFAASGIKPGDVCTVEEITSNVWAISKQP